MTTNYKQAKILIPLLGFITLLVLVSCLVRRYQHSEGIHKPEEESYPGKCIAKGLRLDEYYEGRKVFSLKTDSLKVVGKKTGFFRLGFWNVARLENVCIDFYQQPVSKSVKNAHESATKGAGFPDLKDLFLRHDRLKPMMARDVKGVEISNIEINLYREDKITSTLCSNEVKLNPRGNKLIFEGNVRMTSGMDKQLECSRITWLTDDKKFRTAERYVVRVEDRIIEGKGLETDYLLDKVEFMGRRK